MHALDPRVNDKAKANANTSNDANDTNMQTRYLLWDHDGVLVDTERWYFEATRTTLARVGVALSQPQFLALSTVGKGYWEAVRERGASEADVILLRAERDGLYQDFLRSEPIEIEGVAEALDELADHYRMAIVTTARRSDFDLIHDGRDLVRRFEFVLTLGDYQRAKPHPDPYLAGLARFGADPAEALALEDSTRGLTSACAAGLRCVVIRNDFMAADDFSDAWRLVDSIGEVPPLLAAHRGQEANSK
jgi:HAD superfamily hydrolase (TIGR01509 family)